MIIDRSNDKSKPAVASGWRNEYNIEVPLIEASVSDAAIIAAVHAEYPIGSSWGALRWRAGVYDIEIDRKAMVVRFRESEGMAD